jgi:hypothetical protein
VLPTPKKEKEKESARVWRKEKGSGELLLSGCGVSVWENENSSENVQ